MTNFVLTLRALLFVVVATYNELHSSDNTTRRFSFIIRSTTVDTLVMWTLEPKTQLVLFFTEFKSLVREQNYFRSNTEKLHLQTRPLFVGLITLVKLEMPISNHSRIYIHNVKQAFVTALLQSGSNTSLDLF